MGEELLTVIIPIYNVQDYLPECLESIAKQTFRNYTVILIDDGSTDTSGEICDQWVEKDSRFKVIHKQNGGVSSARNEGIRHAKAKYTLFIDPDDYISQEMFEQMITVAEKEQADMVICQYFEIMPNGEIRKHFDGINETEVLNQMEYMDLLLADQAITDHFWRRLFKTEKIRDLEFTSGMNFEDTHAIVRFSQDCAKIVLLNEGYYYYRYNPNGIVREIVITNFDDHYRAMYEKYTSIGQLFPTLKEKSDSYLVTKTVDIYGDLIRENMSGEQSDALKKELKSVILQYSLVQVQGKLRRIFAWSILHATPLATLTYKCLHVVRPNAI
ncbi:glycosyltransferase family 2 protein [Ligilactobacillus apodemi]|uniref:Beta(1,4)galactosyltransferase epsj n=1 Tax=Ligilactobacillus apodemi DSM 16634 = JCM 16172 TaxID=1423724 RepID=A0A0R1U274_9LACO|nr:glycosyltransferase [Ligilactobacillus apodemi]KRL87452.1 beta(1,4)galactosyltransferase epsj [Ligilactobacillus apodemi DSM 16634 = JCM 16172]MCR1901927.1 glycosyltransferase [Ligilactobacillus apodemi]